MFLVRNRHLVEDPQSHPQSQMSLTNNSVRLFGLKDPEISRCHGFGHGETSSRSIYCRACEKFDDLGTDSRNTKAGGLEHRPPKNFFEELIRG